MSAMSTASAPLPARPHLDHLKKQAKDLLRGQRSGDRHVCQILRDYLPKLANKSDVEVQQVPLTLHDAQHAVARQHGFDNWSALRRGIADRSVARRPTIPRFEDLDERMRRHLEGLGFSTVGGYRVWCHKQGLGNQLDKSDTQLVAERERARQLGGHLEPQVSSGYRRGQAEFIQRAFEGRMSLPQRDAWLVLLFSVTQDEEEREALRNLLLHVEKYTHIPWPAVAGMAPLYKAWRQPVERFFPTKTVVLGELQELSHYLLGHGDAPPLQNDALDAAIEAAANARVAEATVKHNVLSSEQIESFRQKGYLRLREAFDPQAALEIQDFMWSELGRLHGFRRDDPESWKIAGRERILPGDLKLNDTRDHPVYHQVATPKLLSAYAQLAGQSEGNPKQSWGGFGLLFPQQVGTPWRLRDNDWHLDTDATPDMTLIGTGLRVQTMYSSIRPGGGGTLIVEGSHRLARKVLKGQTPMELVQKKTMVQERFARSHAWLAELSGKLPDGGDRIRRFMQEGTEIDGVPVRVVELTGEPGDAVLWHRALCHSRSMNCTASPRFVRT